MLTGAGLVSWGNNEPTQYAPKQQQFFSPESRTFTQMMARYSSDFVEAQMQGIDPANPLEYQTRYIRFSDIVKPSAAIQRHFDDYKMILVADKDIEYIVPGSKIITLGSTWIVVNPLNASGSDGSALVRRCNAVWNFLDFYGNIVSEPLVVENERANANDSDNQQSLLISKGYFNVLCQYNDNTRQIDTNTRFILGTGAYRVTGYSDFETEFTGDYSSVRTLSFTVRYEEPNEAIDDMENHIAGGKTFSWEIGISGPKTMRVGESTAFALSSTRNGYANGIAAVCGDTLFTPSGWSVAGDVLYTPGADVNGNTLVIPHCANYIWSSSDDGVLQIDACGNATAISEGVATLTATLAQNPAYSASVSVQVEQAGSGVQIFTNVPDALAAYEYVTITAAYFENGEQTENALTWTFSGADETAYAAEVSEDGLSAEIYCYGYSPTPLEITAAYGESSVTVEISLEGI